MKLDKGYVHIPHAEFQVEPSTELLSSTKIFRFTAMGAIARSTTQVMNSNDSLKTSMIAELCVCVTVVLVPNLNNPDLEQH